MLSPTLYRSPDVVGCAIAVVMILSAFHEGEARPLSTVTELWRSDSERNTDAVEVKYAAR